MRWMKAFLVLCLALFLILVGIVIAMNNPEPIQANLILWQLPEVSLGVLLTLVLLFGCILGLIGNTFITWRIRRQRNKLQKQLDQSQKRFEQLQ